MGCSSILPAGINKDCKQPAGNISSFAFTTLSTSFANIDEAKKTGNWVEKIRSMDAWLSEAFDWENNTSDIGFTEAWDGSRMMNNKPKRGYFAYLSLNAEDAKKVENTFNGDGNVYVYEVYQNGLIAGKVDSTGVTTGFTANCILEDKGAIKDDLNRYKLHINFLDSADEISKYGTIFKPSFNPATTFKTYTPESCTVTYFGEYSTDTVQVKVTQGGDALNTLVTGDWELMAYDNSVAVTLTVTYVAASDGLYDVVTSAGLDDFGSISFRVNKGTPATTLASNTVEVVNAA